MTRHFATAPQFTGAFSGQDLGRILSWIPATECFLVVSGYFLAHMFRRGDNQYLSLRSFAVRRMYRLVIPYWVAFLSGVIVVSGWRWLIPAAAITLPTDASVFAANLLCVADLIGVPIPFAYLWTILALIQIYFAWSIIFWMIRYTLLRRHVVEYHNRTIEMVVAFTVGTLLLAGVWAWGGYGNEYRWGLPKWCMYTSLGSCAYWYTRRMLSMWVLACILAWFLFGAYWASSPRPLFGAVTAALLVGATSRDVPSGWAFIRVAGLVGSWSYSVYLVQSVVMLGSGRFSALLTRCGIPPDTIATAWLHVGFFILLNFQIGYLFFKLVEQPCITRASRIGYRS